MFNIVEMLFIAVLALLLIGPRQLPEVARTVGRLLNEFRRASDVVFAELKKSPIKPGYLPTGKDLVKDLSNEIKKEVVPESLQQILPKNDSEKKS